jgi:hypothetical protein
VVNGIGCHRTNQTNVINDRADLREQRADFDLVFAKLLKRMLWAKTNQRCTLQLGDLLTFGHRLWHRLTVHLGKLRLWVKCLEVAWPAGHTQPDHPLGFPPRV